MATSTTMAQPTTATLQEIPKASHKTERITGHDVNASYILPTMA